MCSTTDLQVLYAPASNTPARYSQTTLQSHVQTWKNIQQKLSVHVSKLVHQKIKAGHTVFYFTEKALR